MSLNVTPRSVLRAFLLLLAACVPALAANDAFASSLTKYWWYPGAKVVSPIASNTNWYGRSPLIKTGTNAHTFFAPGPISSSGISATTVTTGLCLLCSVTSPTQSYDGNLNTATIVSTAVGVAARIGQRIVLPGTYEAGDSIVLDFEVPTATLSLSVLGGIRVEAFNGNTSVMAVNLNELANLQLLGGGIGASGKQRAIIPATGTFDRVEVTVGSVLAALGGLYIYEVKAVAPVTVSPAGNPVLTPAGTSAALTASHRLGAATFRWYDAPAGGTLLHTGATYNTPVLTRGKQQYWVAAAIGSDTSFIRTAVNVEVGGPGPLWTYGDEQTSPVITGICVGCFVTNPLNASDADTATFSVLNTAVGVAGGVSQIIHFPGTYQAGDSVAVMLELPNSVLSANLLGGITLQSYNGNTPNGDAVALNSSLVRLDLLGGAIGGNTGKVRITIPVNTTFDGVSVGTSAVLAGLSGLRVYEAAAFMPLTITPPAQTIPIGSTATMSASVRAGGATYAWYETPSGGTPLATTASFTSPPLNRSKTYYAEASTPDGLKSFARTATTVTVAGGPVPLWTYGDRQDGPVINGVCLGCNITNPAAAADGDTTTSSLMNVAVGALGGISQIIHFPGTYQAGDSIAVDIEVPDQTLGVSLLGGITLETYNGNTPNGDAVQLNNSVVRVDPLLGVGTGSTGKFRVTIPVNATTFDGVRVGTSNVLSGLSGLRIYEAVAFMPVIVTPPNPVIPAGTSATMTASVRAPGATYNWYETPDGGTPVATTAAFTTPNLSRSKKYYVSASTPDGLTSFRTTQAAVTVSGGPGPLWTYGDNTQSPVIGGVCIGCQVQNPNLAVDGDTTTASQAIMTVGALGSVGQLLQFPGTYQVGDSIAFTLGVPAQALSAGLLAGIRVQTFNGTTPNNDAVMLDNSLLQLQALGLDVTGNVSKFRVTMPVTAPTFDGAQIDLTGLVSALSSLNIYEAAAFIPVTVTPPNPSVPFGSDTTLSASIRLPNATFAWYDQPTGGTPLFTGADFNTPVMVQDRTFYVEASTPDGLTSYVRTAVPVTVAIGPSSPDLSCGRGITETSATTGICLLCAVTNGPLAVDDNPTTASRLNAPVGVLGGVYQRIAFGQESSPGDSLRIVVGSTTGLLNLGLLNNVTIRPRNNGAENTADVRALSNGLLSLQLLDGGTRQVISFVPSQVFDEVDFRIDGLATALTEINLYYVQQITPMATVAADTVNVCSGETAVLTATTPATATFNWYDAPSGGTPLFTGAAFTTPAVTADGVYYVEAVSGTTGCASEVRTPVFVKVGLASVSVTANSVTIPQGGTATFNVNTPDPALTYNWYTAPTGGTPVFSGPSFTTPALNATATYYVEATTATGCSTAARIPVVANVIITNPDVPCDIATTQVSNANGICVGCYVDNQGSAVDGSIQSFSTMHTILGLAGAYVQQTLIFPSSSDAGDSVRLLLSFPASVADLTLLGGVQVATYNGTTFNNDRTNINGGALLNLQLLPGNQQALITFAPAAVFDRVEVRLNTGLAGAVSAVNVHYANRFVPVPDVQPDTVTICAGGTATFDVVPRPNTIFRWYSAPTGGTLLFTGTSYTTGTLSADTAFYVEAAKTSTNCINPVRTRAVVTIGAAPVAPTVENNSVTTCSGTTATLRATGPAGATFNWYSQQTGGTAVFTGAEFITPVLDSSAVYYVEAVSAGGCISATRTSVQVDVTARPETPDVTPAGAAICAGGTATLTATSATTGATFNWYTDATLGTLLFTGPSFTTPALTTTTTYYVVAANGQCNSAAARAVTVVVNTVPVQPTVTINPASGIVEYGATATLTAASTTPGVTFRWFLDSTLTTPVFTGNPFVTPVLANTTTYYVEATGAGGCASARTAATVTVNRNFNPGCDFANAQTTTGGGICVLCTVLTPDNSVDNDTTNFATLQLPVAAVGAFVGQRLNFGSLAAAGDTVKVRMSFPAGLLNASVFGAIQVESYNNGVANGDAVLINSNAVSINILPGANQRAVLFAPGDDYDAIEVRVLGGVLGALQNVNVHYANRILSAPVITPNNQTICAGTSATITATASDSATIRWYTTASGGTPVATGTQFVTGPLTATTTYYAESYRASTNCVNPIRTPVTIQVLDVPELPVILRGDTALCSGNNAILIARAVNPAHTIRWFSAATGGTLLSSDSVFTTAALTTTTTFYAEAFNGTCGSATRVPVTVTVTTAPTDPVLESNNVTICGNTSATLRVTSPTAGLTIRWYSVQSGGTPVFTGPEFTTPLLNATTIYYVEAVNALGGCINPGGRIPATVTVNATPGIPVLTDSLRVICGNQPVTLSVQNPVPGVTYNWYNAATGGTIVFTGASVTTPALTDTTTYFVEAVGTGGCISNGRAVQRISVQSTLPAPTVESANVTVCRGAQATLRVLNPQAGISYEWYDAPGGTRLFTGAVFVTGAQVANTSYYVQAVSAGGCVSATQTQVNVAVSDAPALPVVTGNTAICAGSTATLSILNPVSGVIYTWFNAAGGGVQLAEGTTYAPAGLTATTTIYVQASNGTCISAGRTAVTVTVNPVPPAVTLISDSLSICTGGTATFQVQAPQAGVTYRWYSAVTGGTLLATATSYTTPVLTANASYFVEAVNGNNCTSLSRTRVAVGVTAGPTAPVVPGEVTSCRGGAATASVTNPQPNIQYRWYNEATGGTPIFIGNTFTVNPLNARDTVYVESEVTGGNCASSTRSRVIFIPADVPATPVLVNAAETACTGATATFTVQNPVTGVTYNWYNAAAGGTLLQSSTSPSYTTGVLSTTTTVYVQANLGQCASSARASATVTVNPAPPVVTVTADTVTVCSGNTATFQVQNPQAGVTYRWYTAPTGGTLLTTANSYTTATLTTDTSFYVEAVSASNCVSTSRTRVRAVVTTGPAAPGVPAEVTACRGTQATATISNPMANVEYRWYNAATGGTPVFTGNTYTINPLNIRDTFFVEARVLSGGCLSATRSRVIFIPADAPTTPVLVNANVTVCAGSTATFNVQNPVAGVTYNWYDAITGGTLLQSSSSGSYTTPALSANTTVYVQASLGQCGSTGRVSATAIVNPAPPVVTVTANAQTICTGSTASFQVQAPQAGITYRWYSAMTGGTLITTGTSFTTTTLTADTAYYVEALNANNCTSPARTRVTVVVTTGPATPNAPAEVTACRGTQATATVNNPLPNVEYRWFNAATGGAPVFTGNSFSINPLNLRDTLYVEARVIGGTCVSSTRASVIFIPSDAPATPVLVNGGLISSCAGSPVTFTVQNPVAGVTYNWYTAATGGTLLQSNTSPSYTTGALTTNTTVYVQAVLGTCSSLARATATATVSPVPPAVTVIANSQTICSGGTATFQVQNPQAGVNYRWFSAATGGTLLANAATYTTPALTANTSYFVEAVNAGNCASLTRTQVNVVITAGPDAPAAPAEVSACRGNRGTASITSPQANAEYRWYDVPTGGTAVFTGSAYTSEPLNARDTFYVESRVIGGTCVSSTRTRVIFIPADAPATPVLVNGGAVTVCSGTTATFNVQNPIPGVTYSWYDASTGGTLLQSNTSGTYTTGVLTTNITVYVAAVVGSGCTSPARAAATATVGQMPTPPTVTADALQVCEDSSATIRATSAQAGVIFNWYTQATGGTPVFTGPVYTTPGLTAPATYYVSASLSGGCVSATRASINIGILEPLPAPTVTVASETATSITFQWDAVAGAIGYRVSTDGGITFTQPSSGLTGVTHTVTNLQPNQTVSLQVMAVGATACANSAWFLGGGSTDNPAGNTVFVPNAFTPNGDGVNDVLFVYGTTIASMEIRIFNQWGQMIFESKDKGRGWDGTVSGTKQPVGVYNYVLRAQLQDGTVVQKRGTITIVR